MPPESQDIVLQCKEYDVCVTILLGRLDFDVTDKKGGIMYSQIAIRTTAAFLTLLVVYGTQGNTNQQVTQLTRTYAGKNTDEKLLKPETEGIRIPFTANCGQTDAEVKFYARTFGGMVFVTKSGEIVYSLLAANQVTNQMGHKESAGLCRDEYTGLALTEQLIGGRIGDVRGQGLYITKINCFRGNDSSQWRRNVPSYESVNLGEVCEGINLRLKAYGNNVEKLFCVNPGADVDDIRVRLSGADGLRINDAGELEVKTDLGVVAFTKPVAYQELRDTKEFVEAAYVINGDEYGFIVEDYDRNRTLVIDPLIAATYLGGTGEEGWQYSGGIDLELDGAGNLYLASMTASADFPVTEGAYQCPSGGNTDVFVAKLNPELTEIIAATVFGGAGNERDISLALDGEANVYVAGFTTSPDFPTTAGAYDRDYHANQDGFIAKFNSSLDILVGATLIGGTGDERYGDIAVDDMGNVFLGLATSSSADMPTPAGAYDTLYNGGDRDFWVGKFNSDLTALLAGTYVGGQYHEQWTKIDISPTGEIYLAGGTGSFD